MEFSEIVVILSACISLIFAVLALISGINDIFQEKKLDLLEERLQEIDDVLALLKAYEAGEVSDVEV